MGLVVTLSVTEKNPVAVLKELNTAHTFQAAMVHLKVFTWHGHTLFAHADSWKLAGLAF